LACRLDGHAYTVLIKRDPAYCRALAVWNDWMEHPPTG